MVILNGYLNPGGLQNDGYSLSLDSLTWCQLRPSAFGDPTVPNRRDYSSAVVSGGLIYVFGGNNITRQWNDLWAFNPDTASWTFINMLPSNPVDGVPAPRFLHVAFLQSPTRMWVFGGMKTGNPTTLNDQWIADLAAQTWTRWQPSGAVPAARAGMAVTVGDNIAYLYGGQPSGGLYFGDLWSFDMTAASWTLLVPSSSTTPGGRSEAGMVLFGSSLWLTSGRNNTNTYAPFADMWSFNLISMQWQQLGLLGATLTPRHARAFVNWNATTLILFGGVLGSLPLNDLYFLDPISLQLTTLNASNGQVPLPRVGFAIAIVNSSFVPTLAPSAAPTTLTPTTLQPSPSPSVAPSSMSPTRVPSPATPATAAPTLTSTLGTVSPPESSSSKSSMTTWIVIGGVVGGVATALAAAFTISIRCRERKLLKAQELRTNLELDLRQQEASLTMEKLELEKQRAQVELQAAQARLGGSIASPSRSSSKTSSRLAADWDTFTDDEQGKEFQWNPATGESRWPDDDVV